MSEKTSLLASAVLEKLDASSSLSDVTAAIGAAKSAAELEKVNMEIRTASTQTRFEWFKVIGSVLVPVVSILGILYTVSSTRQHDEDTQWREFLSTFHAQTSSTIISHVTLSPRLRSFFDSRSP